MSTLAPCRPPLSALVTTKRTWPGMSKGEGEGEGANSSLNLRTLVFHGFYIQGKHYLTCAVRIIKANTDHGCQFLIGITAASSTAMPHRA